MLSSEQMERMVARASRAANPVIYPSNTHTVAVVAKRHAYRKGPATLVINLPDKKSGVQIRRGKYDVEGRGNDFNKVQVIDDGDSAIRIKNQVARVYGTARPSMKLQPGGGPKPAIMDVEDGFYKAILKTSVILFQDKKIAFYSSDQCNPLYVGSIINEPLMNGIIIPTPMLRSLLREGFYSSLSFYPTATAHDVGGAYLRPDTADGLGIAIVTLGETGERYTIIQSGSVVATYD